MEIGQQSNSVVQAQRMEVLEKNNAWKEPDFDTVLQYLRTILLRRKYTAAPLSHTIVALD
jgi:hypothetical protein